MKGPGPRQPYRGHRGARPPSPQGLAHDAFGAADHLQRRAPREGQQQDPGGIDTLEDQMGDAVGQRVGLARARTGDDQQRSRRKSPGGVATTVTGCPQLGLVE
jgi:hypothetical protein